MNYETPALAAIGLAADDQPKYKLRHNGAASLSNSELLSLIIGPTAKQVLHKSQNNLKALGQLSMADILKVPGIGESKAATLVAAIELGRRRQIEDCLHRPYVRTSKDISEFIKQKIGDFNHEVFCVLYLNKAQKIKHFEVISEGGIDMTCADTRIILKRALEESAVMIILAHNHPSGSLRPSRQDEELTKKIKEAAKYFDITVLDHINNGSNSKWSDTGTV